MITTQWGKGQDGIKKGDMCDREKASYGANLFSDTQPSFSQSRCSNAQPDRDCGDANVAGGECGWFALKAWQVRHFLPGQLEMTT